MPECSKQANGFTRIDKPECERKAYGSGSWSGRGGGGGGGGRVEARGELLDEETRGVERVEVSEAGERDQVRQQRLLVRLEQAPESLRPITPTLHMRRSPTDNITQATSDRAATDNLQAHLDMYYRNFI